MASIAGSSSFMCLRTGEILAKPSSVCRKGRNPLKRRSSRIRTQQHQERVTVEEQKPAELDTKSPSFDVSSNCVNPVFRSFPKSPQDSSTAKKAKVLFLSEGNVCRSIFAEAIFSSLIEQEGLQDVVECSSKATRDYNLDEPPDPRTMEVADDLGLQIKPRTASLFDCATDVVEYDLLLVMDKFTASDALKDITIFEAVDKSNSYGWKVRRLGEFCDARKIEDIDDPLYGNTGDAKELEEVHRAVLDISDSCKGLMRFLIDIHSNLQDSENLKQGIIQSLGNSAPTDWLVPPMLQGS